jgi:hypothetical protein
MVPGAEADPPIGQNLPRESVADKFDDFWVLGELAVIEKVMRRQWVMLTTDNCSCSTRRGGESLSRQRVDQPGLQLSARQKARWRSPASLSLGPARRGHRPAQQLGRRRDRRGLPLRGNRTNEANALRASASLFRKTPQCGTRPEVRRQQLVSRDWPAPPAFSSRRR